MRLEIDIEGVKGIIIQEEGVTALRIDCSDGEGQSLFNDLREHLPAVLPSDTHPTTEGWDELIFVDEVPQYSDVIIALVSSGHEVRHYPNS